MSISTALKSRREALQDREGGFTLIELLVVVIIIGILAAIAIPVYIGVQNGAKDASAKSDLTNARTAAFAFYTGKGSWPALNATTLADFGWTGANNTAPAGPPTDVTSGTVSSTNFCVKELSGSGTTFYVAATGDVTSTKPANCN